MSAAVGNKYAEKYTLEEAHKIFSQALEILESDPQILFIGEVAVKQKIYRELYAYLVNKFSDDEKVFNAIKTIETIIEARLNKAGLTNDVNATMAIFGLKNNHGWKDRTETDFTFTPKPINAIEFIENASIEDTKADTKQLNGTGHHP